MISISIIRKSFGNETVLSNVQLKIEAGETVALLGPSGIGKTTLLRIIAGLDSDFDGEVSDTGRHAMVFQEPTLLKWRTALENLTLINDLSDAEARIYMEEVGLAGKEDHYPGQLSLGQQRRLALARAFSAKPDFLIMDEPFASLDADRSSAIIKLTWDLIEAKGLTTLFVTHAQWEAEKLADRILRLEGSPARLV